MEDELIVLSEKNQPVYVQPVKPEAEDPLKSESRTPVKRTPPKSFSIKNVITGASADDETPKNHGSKAEPTPEVPPLIDAELEDEGVLEAEAPFDQNDLDKAWNEYTTSYLKDKPKYSSITNNYKPILKDDYVLQISFENSFQQELFREFKHEMAIFLRKKLNNALISFAEEVNEQENSKTKIYTVDDKFRFMSQKNPNIIKLKQQLNLDFD